MTVFVSTTTCIMQQPSIDKKLMDWSNSVMDTAWSHAQHHKTTKLQYFHGWWIETWWVSTHSLLRTRIILLGRYEEGVQEPNRFKRSQTSFLKQNTQPGQDFKFKKINKRLQLIVSPESDSVTKKWQNKQLGPKQCARCPESEGTRLKLINTKYNSSKQQQQL